MILFWDKWDHCHSRTIKSTRHLMRLQCEQFATEIDSSQNVRKHSPKMRCRQNKPNYSSNLLNYEQISALKHWLRIYTSTSSAFAVKAKRITEKFTCAQYPSTISWSKHTYNLPSPAHKTKHPNRSKYTRQQISSRVSLQHYCNTYILLL